MHINLHSAKILESQDLISTKNFIKLNHYLTQV